MQLRSRRTLLLLQRRSTMILLRNTRMQLRLTLRLLQHTSRLLLPTMQMQAQLRLLQRLLSNPLQQSLTTRRMMTETLPPRVSEQRSLTQRKILQARHLRTLMLTLHSRITLSTFLATTMRLLSAMRQLLCSTSRSEFTQLLILL